MRGDSPADSSLFTADGTEVSLGNLPLHSTNLLTLLDAEGIIQYESPSVERLYGYDQETLVGEQVADYFHPDDCERVTGAFRTVVTSDEYVEEAVEYRHRRADGTYTWVESVASANPTPEGYYVVNSRDISARKEREQRLERTNARLEEFASIVSHDLRNPLNVAQLRLQQVQMEHESEHLAAVEQAHLRMANLVDDLLTLARTEKQTLSTESVALDSLSEQCWQTVVTGDATLVVVADTVIDADYQRLRQLLENLLRNAVEHGSPRDDDADCSTSAVTVTVGELANGFYVEDDGLGVPADKRETLFEPGVSRTVDGTGLGLHIVDGIVDAHGWEISITEGSQGGARFEIVTSAP